MAAEWMTTLEACTTLGVSARTLGVYAKRGFVRRKLDARDTRRAVYLAADVRKIKRGEPEAQP